MGRDEAERASLRVLEKLGVPGPGPSGWMASWGTDLALEKGETGDVQVEADMGVLLTVQGRARQ
jgi:hypothetical protein